MVATCGHKRDGHPMVELIEIEEKQRLRHEEAAATLRWLTGSLSRHNELEFVRGGLLVRVEVPKQVELEVEIEVGTEGGSLDVEVS
jgi:amphi-Trp domain-containing protein